MIVSIGEAYIKDNGIAGAAVESSLEITRLGASAMFAGAVSSDTYGTRILEYLVDNCIFFDPLFCNDEKPTWVEGSARADRENSCIFSLDSEKLENTINMNTDARLVLPNSIAFTSPAVRDSVRAVIDGRPDMAVCLDLTAREQDEEVCRQWAGISEIVIADENTAETLRPYCKNVLVAAKPGFSSTAGICIAADEALATAGEKAEDRAEAVARAVQALLKNGLNDCSILTCLP